MTTMPVRGASLYVKVMGQGEPLLLLHGGPGLDHLTLGPLQRLADDFTLVYYDQRCHGRSGGVPVTSLTWDNLTADADALRQMLGFEQWAILGNSFGGMVALEYALRYPRRVSHLLLVDTCGDTRWVQEKAPEVLAERGFDEERVALARRFFNGQITPEEMTPAMMKLGSAYYHHLGPRQLARDFLVGLRMKVRPEALIYGYGHLLKGWTVMDRLGEIQAPTLVLAGRDDFQFPPEHQAELAAGIPNARLEIIERAGHNAVTERPAQVAAAVRAFLQATAGARAAAAPAGAYAAVDAYVEDLLRRLKIPGAALAIVAGEEIVHVRGFGRARPGGEEPTGQTPFYIGSLTKSFTALAVMQLVEAGKMALDAPVQRYLPWFRVAGAQASRQMTVRHLLTQTSGLPGAAGEIPLADFDDSPGAAERHARSWATLTLHHPPGAVFEYSNANYILLGLIVEAVSGQPYEAIIQNRIFAPLGMAHSYTAPAAAQADGLAAGYRYWFAHPFPAPSIPFARAGMAGGMLISSAEDMGRYLLAHLNGGRYQQAQILSSAAIDEMHRAAVGVRWARFDLGQYGLGWYADKIGATEVVWHSGVVPHFFSYMALLPQQKKGVVLLFNASHHWMNPVFMEAASGVTALLAGEQPERAPVPLTRLFPWLLRGLLLVPVLQLAGIAATLWRLRRWRRQPERRPGGWRALRRHLLLPLLPNLLAMLAQRPLRGKRRDYLLLYMPDYAWIALLSGGFAHVWSLVRTGLVLRALARSAPAAGEAEGEESG